MAKSSARRTSAVLPTPTTAPSILPSRASAATSSSPPSTSGPRRRSVNPATVKPHSAARSATARPCPPAPRISSRPATSASPATGREGYPPFPQQQLGQEKIPLRIEIDRRLEAHDHAEVVVAQDVALLHQRRVARHVDGARGLVHRRRVLAADVLVALGEERHRPVLVERLHEIRMVRGLGKGLRRVGAGVDDLLDGRVDLDTGAERRGRLERDDQVGTRSRGRDRKSTRLNSSHVKISYAVFCLKKKKKK